MRRSIQFSIWFLATLLIPFLVSAATVAPLAIEIAGDRGETISSTFSIINTEAFDREYYLGMMGFLPKDDSGAPQFFSALEQTDGFTRWVVFPSESVVVPAQSKADVHFTIAIPDDAVSGGYYAAITVSPAPADVVVSNGAIIQAKTAILLLLTVEGETVESLALLDFTSLGEEFDLPFGTFRYRLQNQGNVHVMPTGTVTLTGVFGQQIGSIDANPADGRVLPSSTRVFEVKYEETFSGWFDTVAYQLQHLTIGPVTATLDISYGNAQSIQSEIRFWVIPWQFLITIVVLAGIAYLPFRARLKKTDSIK